MPNIKFVRVERDCPANIDRRAAGEVRGITYDFDVMIDGERRASLHREMFGKGYRLYDADRRPIGADWRKHLGAEIANKDSFESAVRGFLDGGLIPTVARMAELRIEEAAAHQAKVAEKTRELQQQRMRAAGVQLYEALKAALPILEGANSRCAQDTAFIQRVRAAIAEAEQTHPTDANHIEYEARHR